MIWRRLSAFLLSLAFVCATTGALSPHYCPVHDGPMFGMPGMAGHHHDAPAKDHSHQCSCVSASCCTAAITVPTNRLVALPVVPVRVVKKAAVALRADERPASPDNVVLPLAIGPPGLRA
jgi:hypothetical protein